MTDLIARLRKSDIYLDSTFIRKQNNEAADELEMLQGALDKAIQITWDKDNRIAELEDALKHIKNHMDISCKGFPKLSAVWNIANNISPPEKKD